MSRWRRARLLFGVFLLYLLGAAATIYALFALAFASWGSFTPCRDGLTLFLISLTLVPAVAFAPYLAAAPRLRGGLPLAAFGLGLPWLLLGGLIAIETLNCTFEVFGEGAVFSFEAYVWVLVLAPVLAAGQLLYTVWDELPAG
ncbi:MAG: hypothetical protein AAGH73_12045 [Pseudomonadota bacterium]